MREIMDHQVGEDQIHIHLLGYFIIFVSPAYYMSKTWKQITLYYHLSSFSFHFLFDYFHVLFFKCSLLLHVIRLS